MYQFKSTVGLMAILLLLCFACQKNTPFEAPPIHKSGADYRNASVSDYDLRGLSEKEDLFIGICQAIGQGIQADTIFKQQLWEELAYANARATKEFFLVDFLEMDFKDQNGQQFLDDHIYFKGRLKPSELIRASHADLVLKVPQYVETFFWHEEAVDIPVADFSAFPVAVFPDIDLLNEHQQWVGYGDVEKGITSIGPNEIYEDYLPIHLKYSERYVLVDANNQLLDRSLLKDAVRLHWTVDALNCFNAFVEENVIDANFNQGRYKRVHYPRLLAQTRSCFGEYYGPFNPENRPPTPPPPPPPPVNGEEICNNGIDDDFDGLVDEDDPDCATFCYQEYFRDCVPDINRFTGAKFKGIESYFTYANQRLPQVEENIDFRFLITLIDADENCDKCPFSKDMQPTSNRVLLLLVPSDYENVGIKDEFEKFYMPIDSRNYGWTGYFRAKAIKDADHTDFPPGSIPLGRIGRIKRGFLRRDIPLNAYIYATNWVNIDAPYTLGLNWDASRFGDRVKIDVYEYDTRVSTSTTNNSVTRNATVNITGNVGLPSGEDEGDGSGLGFSFNGGRTVTTSRNYSISAADIVDVGTLAMSYQDKPTPEEFRIFSVFGYGFDSNTILEKYFKGSKKNVRLTDTGGTYFIDAIRIAPQ